jgi:arginine deiminase
MPHTYLDGQKDPLYRPDPMPIPNLLFSRDACMVLGEQLVVGAMHSPARSREPLLLRHVFAHHPELGTPGLHVDFTMHGHRDGLPYMATPTLEGGDVIVFHEGIVLIGLSERTMESAADRLVDALRGSDRFRAVILVNMPAVRNAMHLDTIFTRASREECLVYAPMICNDRPETLRATSIDLSDPHDLGRRHASVLDALAHLGVRLKAIPCGGRGSYVQQAREQWTDGANCFALRDGVILLYGRNRGTAAELARHGYQLVDVANLDFDKDGRCLTTFDDTAKYALLLEGHELSRARGGPRCMTMPLLRDPLPATV